MNKIGEWGAYWNRRLSSNAASEGAVLKGFALAGGISAAVARTGFASRGPNDDELMNPQAFDDNIA